MSEVRAFLTSVLSVLILAGFVVLVAVQEQSAPKYLSPETAEGIVGPVSPECVGREDAAECVVTEAAVFFAVRGPGPVSNVRDAIKALEDALSGRVFAADSIFNIHADKGEILLMNVKIDGEWIVPGGILVYP